MAPAGRAAWDTKRGSRSNLLSRGLWRLPPIGRSGGRRRLDGAIRRPSTRAATGRGPEEPPRQLRWGGPVSSPACDPAPPPASAPLPTTGRVGSRVSRRVLRPVSPPVADRVAPPTPGLHAGYVGPMGSPSPFVHEFRISLGGYPQLLHIRHRGSRRQRSPPAAPPWQRRRDRPPPRPRSAARSSVHRSIGPSVLEDGADAGCQQPDHQDDADDHTDQDPAHERPPSFEFACSVGKMQEACRRACRAPVSRAGTPVLGCARQGTDAEFPP